MAVHNLAPAPRAAQPAESPPPAEMRLDGAGRVVQWEPGSAALFGLPAEAAGGGLLLTDLFAEPRDLPALLDAARREGLLEFSAARRRADGAPARTMWTLSASYGARGALRAYHASVVPMEADRQTAADAHAAAVRAAQDRLRREIQTARTMQQRILPSRLPEAEGYRFAARYLPSDAVSGDYYNLWPIDEERMGLLVADVSGHGMEAMRFTFALSEQIAEIEAEALSRGGAAVEPIDMLRLLNARVGAVLRDEAFFTAFYAVLDRPERRLRWARAGHPYPLLARGGDVFELSAGGPPLGMLPDASWPEGVTPLRSGDRLLVYTDGLIEAGEKRPFGEERLKRELLVCAGAHPEAALDAILEAVGEHVGHAKLEDDVNAVLLEAL